MPPSSEQSSRPTSGSLPDEEGDLDNGGWWPLWVSLFHLSIIVTGSVLVLLSYGGVAADVSFTTKLLIAACVGGIGGTLNASRSLVRAVRYGRYQRRRMPWQVLMPLHSAALGAIAVVFLEAGALGIVGGEQAREAFATERYMLILMSYSFLVGFVSEVFVKRLRKAADSLFGEQADVGSDQKITARRDSDA